MRMGPTGKGYYIWNPLSDPASAAAQARAAGIGHIVVKISDGTFRFPYPRTHPVDPTPELISAFRDAGIEVWGWGYKYGFFPREEAAIAVNRCIELGVRGFVVNAEVEYKRHTDRQSRAKTFMKALRDGLGEDFPIGLSSYRFPSYHPELPWKEFLSECDFNSPQVYWVWATNPGGQLKRSIQEFSQMAVVRPIYPTGAAFAEHGWQATPAQCLEFLNTAVDLGLPGANFWEWAHTRSRLPECWNAIASFPWEVDSLPEPEPIPPDDPDNYLTYIVTAKPSLRVRSLPSLGGAILGLLPTGSLVKVYNVEAGWAKISHDRSEWVSMAWLKSAQPEPVYRARCTAVLGLFKRPAPSVLNTPIGHLSYREVTDVWGIQSGWAQLDQSGNTWASHGWLVRV